MKNFWIVIFSICHTLVTSQTIYETGKQPAAKSVSISVGVTGGIAFPIGDFGSTNPSGNSGYATPGFFVSPAFELHVSKHVSFSAFYHFQQNGFNISAFQDQARALLGPVNTTISSSSGYGQSGYGVGVKFLKPLESDGRANFLVDLQFGNSRLTSPQISGIVTMNGNSGSIQIMEGSTSSYFFQPGAGFLFRASSEFNLGAVAYYRKFVSTPVFNNVLVIETPGGTHRDILIQNMNSFNVGVFASLCF